MKRPGEDVPEIRVQPDIDWLMVASSLFGGMALFLYGMRMLETSLVKIAGKRLRTILTLLSSNKFIGLLFGFAATSALQSSTITTVMLVGFVSSGVMTFEQAVGVLLGVGIGATVTGQIVALDLGRYSLALIALGYIINLFKSPTRKKIGHSGITIMGLGLVFFGLDIISNSMNPLKTYKAFLDLLTAFSDKPILGVLMSLLLTCLIQSSSAVIGIAIVLAQQHLLDLTAGVSLMLGANIGTCLTSIIAALGKPPKAKRVAFAFAFFKTVGAVLIFPVLSIFIWFLELFSTGDNPVPQQIANSNTLFNVLIAVGFFPFTERVAEMITQLFPDKPPIAIV